MLPRLLTVLVSLGLLGQVPSAPGVAPRQDGTTAAVAEAPGRELSELFRLARTRNESVLRAAEAVRAAEAERRSARSAMLPQVNLEDRYFRQNKVSLDGAGAGGAFSFSDYRNEVLLRFEQAIFHGLQERSRVRAAAAVLAASEDERRDSERLLYARLTTVFYGVLGREAQVRALEDSVAVQGERLREVRARAEVGLGRRTEALLAETQLAADEAQLTAARNGLAIAREELGFLVGIPVPEPLRDTAEALELPVEAEIDAAVETARRPDLEALEDRIEEARAAIAVARGERMPSLDFNGTWILDRAGFSEFANATDWTAELELRFPLLDGGRAGAGIDAARVRLRMAELDLGEARRALRLEARSARLALGSSLALREQLEQATLTADENYRLAAEEYRNGLATNLEVIAAQNQLLASRLALERQRYQVKFDGLALELALGRRPTPEELR